MLLVISVSQIVVQLIVEDVVMFFKTLCISCDCKDVFGWMNVISLNCGLLYYYTLLTSRVTV